MAKGEKWTEEEDADLRYLWSIGKSASMIAQAMGKARSRNAIIGRLHRLGLCGATRTTRLNHRVKTGAARVRQPRAMFMPAPKPKRVYEPKPAPSEPVALYTMTNDPGTGCRWICGDPRDLTHAMVCGHKIHERKWCAHHFSRVYVAPTNTRLERLARVA